MADSALDFRMGVNLGDIIDDGRDIHGEGVNIAARLEALAEEGGICISGLVYESVRNRIEATYEDLGEKEVKHVSAPVRVYAVRLGAGEAPVIIGDAIADVSVPVEGFGGRSAIAVLPFDNMSGDPEQEYFADGLAEDIITQLSIWRWFPVIARNSTFALKGTSAVIKEVGEKLGAQYVVEGSVRRAGNRVRITAQLIDAPTGHHMWAEKYDRDLDDIFAVQDEITQRIVAAIEPALSGEAQRQAILVRHENLDAWEAAHRGFWHYNTFKKEDFDQALHWFGKSIESDPNQPLAYGGLALSHMGALFRGWTSDPDRTIAELQDAGQKAIAIDDRASRGHLALGWARMFKRRFDLGVQQIERAVEVNPSLAIGHMYLGLAYIFDGRPEEAIRPIELAMRLSPNDPWFPGMLTVLSKAHFMMRDIDKAVAFGEMASDRGTHHPTSILDYANALAHAGRLREARREVERALSYSPEFSLETLRINHPFRHQADFDFAVEGLLEAGLPEGATTVPVGTEPAAEKPSIAVLPFDNLSGDPDQEAFADGMTEDLITDLSKVSGLFVVARNSSSVYKGQLVDIREAAAALGVRYVLEGSVRKSGERVRINAQLIDAATGGHLWADRYDGTIHDVFELQDEVGAEVVSALSVQLTAGEEESLRTVHTQNLDAYELFVRARATPYPPVPDRINAAREMFEQVIVMDPDFAGGYAGVANMLSFGTVFAHGLDLAVVEKAEAMARKAIDLDPTLGWSYTSLGFSLLLQGNLEDGIEAAREAIRRQPGDADAHAFLGMFLGMSGELAEGAVCIERAIQLNPQFVNGPYLNLLGHVNAYGGDYEAARDALELNLARKGPNGPPAQVSLAVAYQGLGQTEKAREIVAELMKDTPNFRLADWNLLTVVKPPAAREKVVQLLVAAGVPE